MVRSAEVGGVICGLPKLQRQRLIPVVPGMFGNTANKWKHTSLFAKFSVRFSTQKVHPHVWHVIHVQFRREDPLSALYCSSYCTAAKARLSNRSHLPITDAVM